MKRIALAASLLAIAACSGGEKAPEAAPATDAPAAAPAPMDSTMKMDTTKKADAPAAEAAAPAAKDLKKP